VVGSSAGIDKSSSRIPIDDLITSGCISFQLDHEKALPSTSDQDDDAHLTGVAPCFGRPRPGGERHPKTRPGTLYGPNTNNASIRMMIEYQVEHFLGHDIR